MLDVVAQQDFSGGQFSAADATRVPANCVAIAENALIDENGTLYRRGGSTYFSGSGWPGSQIKWIWQGTLAGGLRTLVATSTQIYTVDGTGTTHSEAYTGMAGGALSPAVLNGVIYLPGGETYDGTTWGTSGPGGFLAVVANRIIKASDNKVFFSDINTDTFDESTNFHQIPDGAKITGVAAIRDACVVFTDRGTWVISNMAYNLTDTDGNVQHRLDLYARDLILWGPGTASVVGYGGGLIVPARDGVWLMRLGVTSEVAAPLQLLSRSISPFLKGLIRGGFVPLQAAVFQGHYLLPVVFPNGTAIQILCCKLQEPDRNGNVPWTVLENNVGPAYALAATQDGRSLFGATVVTLTATDSKLATMKFFDQGVSTKDADGSTAPFVVTLRAAATGRLNQNTVVKIRVDYALSDAVDGGSPVMIADYEGVAFTDFANLAGEAPVAQDGSFSWPVGQRARHAGFVLTVVDAAGVTLRSMEMFVRRSGRL